MRIAAVQPNTHAGYFDPKYDPAANLRKTVAGDGARAREERRPRRVARGRGDVRPDPRRGAAAAAAGRRAGGRRAAADRGDHRARRRTPTTRRCCGPATRGSPRSTTRCGPVPFGEYVPGPGVLDAVRAGPPEAGRRATTRPGSRSSVMEVGNGRGRREHLLRRRRRRADPRLRRGRRADPGRADEQRRLRAHRRERAAARDRAPPGDRDRPVADERLDRGIHHRDRPGRPHARRGEAVHDADAGRRPAAGEGHHPGGRRSACRWARRSRCWAACCR